MKQPTKFRTVTLQTTPNGGKTLINAWGQEFAFPTKAKRDYAVNDAYKRGALRVTTWEFLGGDKGGGTKKTFNMTVYTERF